MNTQTDHVTWLFDLGNSRLKGAWLRDGALRQDFALAWDAPDFGAVLQVQLARWPAPSRALVASVASAVHAERLRSALQAWPGADVQWLRSPQQGCGITSRYRVPERLGIDRFLAMAAARAEADGAGVIVAGCGTALTLDAVDADGMQREGLIAPSPELMLRSLQGATAMADTHRDAFARAEHDDTARALHAGCRHSAAALVEWYWARQRSEIGDPLLFLHGGWAASLQGMLEEDQFRWRSVLLDHAVLRGLALWAARQIPV
jgi:type III pantothenate kinase